MIMKSCDSYNLSQKEGWTLKTGLINCAYIINVLFTILPGASFLKQLRITLIILTLKNYHLGINLYGF
jgi:hypothetical protein